MTFLQLINKVLRGLREDTATSLSEKYVSHVGQLVNEAKQDLEDMGPWYALRTTVDDTLTPSTSTLDLTANTNERSYLLVDKNRPMAFITEVDEERRLQMVPLSEIQAIRALDPDAQEDIPYAVAFSRSADGLTAHFFPIPDEAYPVRFVFVVPQEDLEEATDVLSVPSEPVWRAALVAAMEERGEEFAGPINGVAERARQARYDALFRDFGAEEITFEQV